MADNKAPRWTRGDAPEAAILPVLENLADELSSAGWDLPAQLWAFRWVDSATPAQTAALDQQIALARDALGTPADGSSWAAFAVEELITLEGRPFDALLGIRLPAEYDGAILTTEAWDYPDDVKEAGVVHGLEVPDGMPPPSEHPRRVELRLLQAISRSGDMLTLIEPRDGERRTLKGDEAAGRMVDALRRVVGLPAGDPGMPVSLMLGRAWLATLAALAETGVAVDSAAVVAADPATQLLALLEEDVGTPSGAVRGDSDATDAIARAMGERMDWELLRRLAVEGHLNTGADKAVLEWCDAPMFARLVLESSPSQRHALEVLASAAPAAATEVQARIRKRGWHEPDSYVPVTPAGRPGRNDPCPCGSGTKFKKCHGAPVPLWAQPATPPP